MSLSTELARFVAPLTASFGSQSQAAVLLRELGLVERLADVGALPRAISDLAKATEGAIATLSTLDKPSVSPAERTVRAIEAVRSVLDAVSALDGVTDATLNGAAAPFHDRQVWQTLARALPGYLLSRWLRTSHPLVDSSLRLMGGIRRADGGGEAIDFAALAAFLSNPGGQLASLATSEPSLVLQPLRAAAAALGATWTPDRIWFEDDSAFVQAQRPAPAPPGFGLAIASLGSGENWSLAFDVDPAPGGAPGVRLMAYPTGAIDQRMMLAAPWSMTASLGASTAAGVVLTPSGPVPAEGATATSASLAFVGEPDLPWMLIGSPGATRLELAGVTFEIGADQLTSHPDVTFTLRTDGLRLVITAGDGDSFIADVLGGQEISTEAALSMSWSSASGFTIEGRAGFDVTIPVGKSVGPVRIETLRLFVGAADGAVATELSAALTISIGPLQIVIDGVGLAAAVSAAQQQGRGAFGDVDFELRFKPPTGLGLSIDVGVVKGGGFVSYDPELHRYAGAAELSILGTGLTAVGVLLTEIPGWPGTWSMFLSLGIRLVGVQLGFGFTLNGVGGLIGVHRALNPEALGAAVRSGELDGFLFPDNPVDDALQIIDAIEDVFPPRHGQYVFGPVVKIGWGTPTIIEVDAGIAIQLPEPLTVSLLGALSSTLPTEDVAIVELHVAFAGTIDFTAGTLKIDASLTGSRVAGLLLTGDMAVRASFLGQPTFLASFGGFHPEFDQTYGFPKLQQLAIALDTGDDLRVTLGSYFALTSNTVQFGAIAEVYAAALGFTAEGGTSFDALIQFVPFGFDIQLKAWVSIRAGGSELLGVLLKGTFKGPNPWFIKGKASFKLLFVETKLEIEATLGDRRTVAAPERVDVQPLLKAELERDEAWSVIEPETSGTVRASGGSSVLALHPAGRIRVAQRIVPLDRALEQYGNAEFAGENRFDVTPVGFEDVTPIDEYFASAQFFEMSDAEKLSAPSFQAMKAGVMFGRDGVAASRPDSMVYDHEIAYRDPNGRARVADPAQPRASRKNATERAMSSRTSPRKSATFGVREVAFVVTDGDTGEVRSQRFDYLTARRQIAARKQVAAPAYEARSDA
jgi:hypothetical protein